MLSHNNCYCIITFILIVIYTGALTYSYSYFGQGHGGIFLSNVACSGVESTLMDCSSSFGVHTCQHYDDAGVKCYGNGL